MKISLEFEDEAELSTWVLSKAKELVARETESEAFHISQPEGLIESTHRRKYWTEVEIQFVKDYYISKSVRWIAKQLRRKMPDVQNKLTQLYKKGLPKKRSRNGKVNEDV